MGHLRRYFISGLLIWLPIWVTILVIKFVVDILEGTIQMLPVQYQPKALFGVDIPGLGVLMTLLVIFFTGLVVANFLGKKLVAIWDAIIARIPLVNTVYSGTKQVMQTLFSPSGQSFRKVYMIEYPRAGCWTIAFQTGEITKEMHQLTHDHPMLTLYVPTTPNPTSGFLLMIPKENAVELDMSVEHALKFVISLGVIQPTPQVKV